MANFNCFLMILLLKIYPLYDAPGCCSFLTPPCQHMWTLERCKFFFWFGFQCHRFVNTRSNLTAHLRNCMYYTKTQWKLYNILKATISWHFNWFTKLHSAVFDAVKPFNIQLPIYIFSNGNKELVLEIELKIASLRQKQLFLYSSKGENTTWYFTVCG